MDETKYKETLKLLDDMQQVYSQLFVALNQIQAKGDACLTDLTVRQFMLLTALAHLEPENATINNIASTLGTSKQNVNRLVTSMVKSGYLSRKQSEQDKRAVNITLTDKGLKVMADNCLTANQYIVDIFQNFSRNEIRDLRESLNKLVDTDAPARPHFEKQISGQYSFQINGIDEFLDQLSKKE